MTPQDCLAVLRSELMVAKGIQENLPQNTSQVILDYWSNRITILEESIGVINVSAN